MPAKIHAYKLQEEGLDTVQANRRSVSRWTSVNTASGRRFFRTRGVRKIRLLTNNPRKMDGLSGHGVGDHRRVPIKSEPHTHNERYLKTKKRKMVTSSLDCRSRLPFRQISACLTKLPPRPAQLAAAFVPRFAHCGQRIQPRVVQGLINSTCKELYKIDGTCSIELFGAPGSFEIPQVAAMVAAQKRHDVIIALGLIMQGRTKHAEFIGASVSHALQEVALKHLVPVIHEVLLVSSEEEARERCLGKKLNRGVEAARAAFVMLRVREELGRNPVAR